MERCQIPYVVLGQAAYDIKHDLPIVTNKIVFGMLERYNVRELVSLFQVVIPGIETTTDGWRICRDGVRIQIKVLTKNYPSVMDPDLVFYKYWHYYVPNPFDTYWAMENHLDR